MAILTREQFAEFEGVLDKVYDVQMKSKHDYLPDFFNVDSSTKAQESHMGMGNVGLMTAWSGQVVYDDIEKLYKKDYRHAKYSSGLKLERELFDDEEFGEVKRRTARLADGVYFTRQAHGASVWENAFDTAITGPDGKPLCAASGAGHPYSPTDATAQVNAGTLALTVANMDTVETAMVDFRDNRGNIIGVTPRALVVGNYYLKTAERIIGSKAEAFVADNTANIYSGYKIMYNPRITGHKWFIVDPDMMKSYLNWYNRRIPKIEMDGEFDSEVLKYKVVGRWSFGWDAWQFCYGNEG